MHTNQLAKENFWSSDLEDIEATFLPDGKKITDLPSALNDSIPPQGSVLLGNTISIDDVVKKPSFFSRMAFLFR